MPEDGILHVVSIEQAVEQLLEVGSQVMTFIFDNKLLAVLFMSAVVGVGCYVISKVKKTAKA